MPASRVVQFDCPSCGDLIELHNVDQEYIETVIKDLAAILQRGGHIVECSLHALMFMLIAHLDSSNEVITIQERKDNALNRQALPRSTADDAASSEGQGTP